MRRRLSTAACRVLMIGGALTAAACIGWHLYHKGITEQTQRQQSIALANAVQAQLDGQAQILRTATLYFAVSSTTPGSGRLLPQSALQALSAQPGVRQIGLLRRVSDPLQTPIEAELGRHALIAATDSASPYVLRTELLVSDASSEKIDDAIASLPNQPAIAAALDQTLAHHRLTMSAPLGRSPGNTAESTWVLLVAPLSTQAAAKTTASMQSSEAAHALSIEAALNAPPDLPTTIPIDEANTTVAAADVTGDSAAFISVDLNALLAPALAGQAVQLFDQSGALLYRSPSQTILARSDKAKTAARVVNVIDRQWRIETEYAPTMSADLGALAVLGISLTLLASAVTQRGVMRERTLLRRGAREKRKQRPLRERINLLQQRDPRALLVLDTHQRIVEINPATEKLLRTSASELLGSAITRFFPRGLKGMRTMHRVRPPRSARSIYRVRNRTRYCARRADGARFCFEADLFTSGDQGAVRYVLLIDGVREAATNAALYHAHPGNPATLARGTTINLDAARMDCVATNGQDNRRSARRLAHDLHDDLGQLLAVLKIDICLLQGQLAAHDAAMRRRVAGINNLVDEMVLSVRRVLAGMPPKMLAEHGLYAALQLLADRFSERHRVRCIAKLPTQPPTLNERGATAIYRIVQEALTNIAKHANATIVTICLSRRNEQLLLQISDNGGGIGAHNVGSPGGFGLIGMRARVDALGGKFAIDSAPERGTVIRIEVPAQMAAI